jgi:hypothetical protein
VEGWNLEMEEAEKMHSFDTFKIIRSKGRILRDICIDKADKAEKSQSRRIWASTPPPFCLFASTIAHEGMMMKGM